jgi:hypothetical protein
VIAVISSARMRIVLLSAVIAIAAFGATSARATTYPNSMDALGDSITQAFNTCATSFTNCSENSWSTGTNATVDSYYLRLKALTGVSAQ